MRFSILTAVIVACYLSVFQFAVFAQDRAVSEAPVLWERYRVSGRSESVLMPKLPIFKLESEWCSDARMNHYYAYAEDVVYEFTIEYRIRVDLDSGSDCTPKRPFGHILFDERLRQLREASPANSESVESKGGRDTYVFANETSTRWIIPDISNDHWVELAIYYRPGARADASKFTTSLDLSNGHGKEIGDGSSVSLGDAGVKNAITVPFDPHDQSSDRLIVLQRSMAPYTEAARQANVQGHVTLQVTMLASGGIGDITVLESLKEGLTESAIAAARRTVFLPKRVNGVPVTATNNFQYGFNIY